MDYKFNDDLSFTFTIKGILPGRSWSNILANRSYGFIATDAGTGHMWHLNSRENRINRWLNDPLATKGTEQLEWRTGDKRVSLFADSDGYDCAVTYGFGYARWDKNVEDSHFSVLAFVPPELSARILVITSDCRDGELLYYTDLVLGSENSGGPHIVTEYRGGVISARNSLNTEFRDDVFRVKASEEPIAFTCDRLSWKSGNPDGRSGAGMLPCAGMVLNNSGNTVIVTGCEREEVIRSLCEPETVKAKLLETCEYWNRLVTPVRIKTDDPALDRYINGWALYQVIACRLFARCSVYQCGGAYGFRDQLQDVTALLYSSPELAREQILRAAAHQFEEGDVQHWWHPLGRENDTDKGVRTRCSDDLLWLVYALCEYVSVTGDTELCRIEAGYIESPPLAPGENERYCVPERSALRESLLDHCIRAAELVIRRGEGDHGLCLMGSGDWNDGMNEVGAEGKGESVWLTWFAGIVFRRLGELCRELDNTTEGDRLLDYAEKYRTAADGAWDGMWYLRGWYGDGTLLGSRVNDECAIDSIAQSFAVFAGADAEKVKTALDSAYDRLFDRDNGIVRLFTPPFDGGEQSPGYIKSYSPGFRENGGQYTHGAVWLARAFILNGEPDRGYELLRALLPDAHDNGMYRAEPYVLAADVSDNEDNRGLAGWSWYTGAAGWYYRTVIRDLLGIEIVRGELTVTPRLPEGPGGFGAELRLGGEIIKVRAENGIIRVIGNRGNNNSIKY
ncbi:MAG: hypothetical protein IJL71_00925 [Oscillospiraceae bacterium]|nr:hypothetical protein [Oscillospiraceae bacterium]